MPGIEFFNMRKFFIQLPGWLLYPAFHNTVLFYLFYIDPNSHSITTPNNFIFASVDASTSSNNATQ